MTAELRDPSPGAIPWGDRADAECVRDLVTAYRALDRECRRLEELISTAEATLRGARPHPPREVPLIKMPRPSDPPRRTKKKQSPHIEPGSVLEDAL